MPPAATKSRPPGRRSGVRQARERLDVNLQVSRNAALRAAVHADNLRDTETLLHLHEAIAALDKAVECRG